ncbi:hypothetical protein EIJ12_19500 [Xanthomonas perforans]|nr:hypothetical protein EIJ02_19065 [Xanthomonas perforans]TQT26856.1 hypothetical protein EIJ12_19500 [Xanthomonas perforans]TQT34759.1 hypothetical protein EIJ21_19565 [Xanthomonas perforans]TQT58048.1 hypothetical protein EIJ76_17980 [Xanthomonas perforans]
MVIPVATVFVALQAQKFRHCRRGRDRTRSPAWGAAHRCRVPRHRQSALILAPARSACRSHRATQPHATEDARRPTDPQQRVSRE